MFGQFKNIIAALFHTIANIKAGAMKYIFWTGIMAMAIFGTMIWATWELSGRAATFLTNITPWKWAHESSLFGFVIGLAVIIGFLMVIKYILLIAMSPVLSYISEKVEKSINPDYKSQGFSVASSTLRSVRINTRNMVKEIVLTIILLIAGLIPGLNLLAIPLLFIIQAYFTGFGLMDYCMERHMTFSQTLKETYKHKYAAVILGAVFMGLFAIPVLGTIFAPYLTTVSGTHYLLKNNIIPISSKPSQSSISH